MMLTDPLFYIAIAVALMPIVALQAITRDITVNNLGYFMLRMALGLYESLFVWKHEGSR